MGNARKFNLYIDANVIAEFSEKAWETDHMSPSQVTEELYKDYLTKKNGLGAARRSKVIPRRPGLRTKNIHPQPKSIKSSVVSNSATSNFKAVSCDSNVRIRYSTKTKKRENNS